MRTWDEPKKRKAHIELIPMIDVMMFLLVFFVLVSLNVIPALGMKTQLPSASSSQQLKPQNKFILTLGLEGQLQLDGKDLTVEALVPALKAAEKPDTKSTIIVNSDKGVEVSRLVEAAAAAEVGGVAEAAADLAPSPASKEAAAKEEGAWAAGQLGRLQCFSSGYSARCR